MTTRNKLFSFVILLFIQINCVVSDSRTSYSIDPNWPLSTQKISMGQATGVAVDSHNHVFIFHRAKREWSEPFPVNNIQDDTVLMFDGNTGQLKNAWGGDLFIMPHGLSVDRQDNVWVTDVGSQQVHKFSHEGALLLSLGESSVKGTDNKHFALPSDVSILKDGHILVSDGYQNTRIIQYTSSGSYKMQWGTAGNQPGEFALPHGIAASDSRIYVADRGNSRLQVFNHKGDYIAEWKGPHIGRPYGVATSAEGKIFIIDGGDQPDKTRSRVIILNNEGKVLDSFSAEQKSDQRNLGHDIAVGTDGAIYVVDAWARSVRKYTKGK